MCFCGCCYYIWYLNYSDKYVRVGRFKYTEKIIRCPYCEKYVQGVYKQKIRTFTCCYLPVKTLEVDDLTLFCELCDKNLDDFHLASSCENCTKIYTFSWKFCPECGNKRKNSKNK